VDIPRSTRIWFTKLTTGPVQSGVVRIVPERVFSSVSWSGLEAWTSSCTRVEPRVERRRIHTAIVGPLEAPQVDLRDVQVEVALIAPLCRSDYRKLSSTHSHPGAKYRSSLLC